MSEIISDGPIKSAAEMAKSSVRVVGEAVLERFTGESTQQWRPAHEVNPELYELADKLEAPAASEFPPAESEVTYLHEQADFSDQPDRIIVGDGLTLSYIGVESVKKTAAVTRWLAGNALQAARRPFQFQRGPQLNEQKLEELAVAPDAVDLVKAVVENIDDLPALDTYATALAYKLAQRWVPPPEDSKPEDNPRTLEGYLVKIIDDATPLSLGQARFITRLQGPQKVLTQ